MANGTTHTKSIADDWKKNPYYDRAERGDWLEPFWHPTSVFRQRFDRLDRSAMAELACGHGRHSARILSEPGLKPGHLYLLDINLENVDYCKRRFDGVPGVTVTQNNGNDFLPLQDQSVTSIFCYDAMVHFEWDCVHSYIKDAIRVLRPGGMAFFHHSNNDRQPGALWSDNAHGRNFMTRQLFSHMAQRAGFVVCDQLVIDWGAREDEKALDCLSLIMKPAAA